MRLREHSEVGFLMLQWLGVLVPTAFRDEVQTWGGTRSAGKTKAVQEEVSRFEAGEVMTWPNVESMLSGEPPDGYEAALLRAAVAGNGVAITHVDPEAPEAGTVTVSTTASERCKRCDSLLGGSYGSVCMNCDVAP
jgi:hypothetical protein